MKIQSLSKSELKLRLIIKKVINEALANSKPVPPKSLLTEEEAAQLLGLAKGTLPVWRHHGKGPNYIKIGTSVRYRISDLKNYVSENTVDLGNQAYSGKRSQ
jgi:predicted DNA-binding transcriptional regulator AlpA